MPLVDTDTHIVQVWSTKLPPKVLQQAAAAGVPVYDPSKSSTQKPLTESTWSIRYGDGSSASGTVVTDVVKIGNIVIEDQAVECASTLSPTLARETADQGLLGLAFGSINTVKPVQQKTPLENMIAQQDIPHDQELFTCYLGSFKDIDDPDQGKSFYTFGGIDQDTVDATGGQITYTPVNTTNGFWEFASESIAVNGQKTSTNGNTAIADTGTTLMMIDDNLAEQVYASIPGAKLDRHEGGWVYPANTPLSQLPSVSVAVGDADIVIEKEHLEFAPAGDPAFVFGGIQGRGSLPINIYGDVFLKNVYAVRVHRLLFLQSCRLC
jgi:hypothetical protein